MAIINKDPATKTVIDLDGPGGNAFALIGLAQSICNQSGIDFDPIQQEMMGGDYENLIAVFDRHFGHIIDLARTANEGEQDDE